MSGKLSEVLYLAANALMELRENGKTAHVVRPATSLPDFELAHAEPKPSGVDEDRFIVGLYSLFLGDKYLPSRNAYMQGGSSPLEIQIGQVKALANQQTQEKRT